MSLFTNPVTFTVNAVARIFNFRAQLPDAKSICSQWFEPAAAMSKDSKITIKHSLPGLSTTSRSLFKYTCMLPIEDGTLKMVTINYTLANHPQHTAVQLDDAQELATVAINSDAFRTAFAQKQV